MAKKFFTRGLLTAILVVVGLAGANVAMAETGPTTTVTQQKLTATINGHKVSAKSLAEGKVTVLSFVWAHGVSQTQQDNSRCRTIGAGTNVPTFWNSGMSSNGTLFWFQDGRTTKVCKVNGVWRKVSCGNLIRFSAPPSHIVTGRVIMVRSFAHVKVRIRAWVHVKATAECGFAEAKASAIASVKLRILVKARGDAVIKIWAQVKAAAKAKASALITCEETPPANQPPSLSNATQPQEVFSNGETYPNICVTASSKDGDSISVGFESKFGSMSPSTVKFTSGGVDKKCSTYQAPNTPDAAGKTEVINFTVHDNTTGLNGTSISVTFPIMEPPAPPN